MRIQPPMTTPNRIDKNPEGNDDTATAEAQKVHVRGWDPKRKEAIQGKAVSDLAHELKDQADISNRGRLISEFARTHGAGGAAQEDSGITEAATEDPTPSEEVGGPANVTNEVTAEESVAASTGEEDRPQDSGKPEDKPGKPDTPRDLRIPPVIRRDRDVPTDIPTEMVALQLVSTEPITVELPARGKPNGETPPQLPRLNLVPPFKEPFAIGIGRILGKQERGFEPGETTGNSGRARHDIAMNAIRNLKA